MKEDIRVPSMGESISEATIGTILKTSGSQVTADDEILELETDKVNQVLYAPADGVLTLSVKSDEVVTIGQVIGTVEVGERAIVKQVEPLPAPPMTSGTLRVSKEDFLEEKPSPIKAPEKRKKLSKIRRVIAERLVSAQREMAMLTTFNEIDLSAILALRARHQEAFKKRYGVKLGFMSFFVKGCLAALEAVPALHSYIEGDEVVTFDNDDIGIAVSTERGLVVPVVRNCNALSFGEIEQAIVSFAEKARDGKLSPEDLQGGCFTITNGGVFGSLLSTPILNPPQSGILGMHKMQKRPVVIDDAVVIRPMMYVALTYDHRLIDGKEAVTFLVHLKNSLEDPASLLLEL